MHRREEQVQPTLANQLLDNNKKSATIKSQKPSHANKGYCKNLKKKDHDYPERIKKEI